MPPDIVLGQVRQLGQVVQGADVLGSDASGAHAVAVVRHVVVGVLDQLAQLALLQGAYAFSGKPLAALQVVKVRLHITGHHPVRRRERLQVQALQRALPQRYRRLRLGCGRGGRSLGVTHNAGPQVGAARRANAILVQRPPQVHKGAQDGLYRLLVQEGDTGFAVLKQRLDFFVGVALGVRGHEDKRLPVVVVAAIVEQVGQDLTRAQDKAALVVAQPHVEGRVQHGVQPARVVVAGSSLAPHWRAPALHQIDVGPQQLAPQPQDVFGLVLQVGVDDAD